MGDELSVGLKVEMVYGGVCRELGRLDGDLGLTKMAPVGELQSGDGKWRHG